MWNRSRLWLVGAMMLACSIGWTPATALDLAAKDAGFVTPPGGSAKGDGPVAKFNYSVGYELHYGDGAPPPPLVAMDRKNYFVFDLAPATAPITAATMRLWTGVLESADAFETYVLKATPDQPGALGDAAVLASTPYPGGFDSPTDFAVAVAASLYMKLGTGAALLASVDVTHADDGSFLSIAFTPAGVAHLNMLRLSGGMAILGGLVTSVDVTTGSPQQPFGFTGPDIPGGDAKTPMLILTLVPEPSSYALMVLGLALVLLRLRGAESARHRSSQ